MLYVVVGVPVGFDGFVELQRVRGVEGDEGLL